MTPEQRQLAHDLVITPSLARRRISKQEFTALFPAALDGEKLALNLLESVILEKSAADLQCVMTIGHVFGFSVKHEDLLCGLISEDWHMSHEDVVLALEKIGAGSVKVVDALYVATQLSLPYLEYDGSRALAVKAIWALSKIAEASATEKLKSLSESDNPILRKCAEERLNKRSADL